MKRIIAFLLCSLCCMQVFPGNPEVKKLLSGEYEREYLLYVPEKYNENNPAGLIVCLHGFNRTMNDFFNDYNMAELAEHLNLIVLAPQALPEKGQDVINTFELIKNANVNLPLGLNAVWGCGLQVKVELGMHYDVTLNAGIDDVAFINRIISETESHYNIVPENKFIFGTSMGGYMSYQYALYHGNDLSGLINICGSMGTGIRKPDANVQLPICDFHSVDDEVVPYTGTTEYVIFDLLNIKAKVTLCQGKEEVIKNWVVKNGANADPIVENLSYPSTTGNSVTKYTYAGENEVIHYKMKGSLHSYFFRKETDCMDYIEEVTKFITAHSKDAGSGNEFFAQQEQLVIYPNPVTGPMVNINIKQGQVAIYDLNGRIVLSDTVQNGTVNIGALNKGIYLISVTSGKDIYRGKLIVR